MDTPDHPFAAPYAAPYAADAELAHDLAIRAGNLLLELRKDQRLQGAALGRAGDLEANVLIMAALRAARPGDAILSEEAVDDLRRLDARRVWIIDPLDGTREYAERRDDWAVHIGLAVDGQPVAGAVAVPARGQCHDSATARLAPRTHRPGLDMLVSRSRPPAMADAVAARLGADVVLMGSAGAKAMAVLNGEADIYLHEGGQAEWDNCAPFAVALAAGLHCCRLDGRAVRYNQREVMVPDLLICRPDLAADVLAAVSALHG